MMDNLEFMLLLLIAVFFILVAYLMYSFVKGKRGSDKLTPGDHFVLTDERRRSYPFNPFDNFLIYGGANSGKTKSIGKPLLEQYIMNGFAGLVYDYKDMDYTKTLYHFVEKHDYKPEVYSLNFFDLDYTDRTNPIKPGIINRDVFLQIIGDVYDGTAPVETQQDFFYTSGKGLFRAVALYFYDKCPEFCTIPHIAQFICTVGRNRLFGLLEILGGEYRTLGSSYCDNFGTEAFSNILSTVTNNLSLLAQNRRINYILSGDDFDFNLIDRDNPKLVSICNSYQIESILAPVISAIFSVSSRAFKMDNPVRFFYLMDEATTFKISDFERLPSVLREYKCSFTYLTQSASKIEKLFSKLDRASIEANFSNAFFGRTKDTEALKVYPLAFGKTDVKKVSRTRGESRGAETSSRTVSEIKEEVYDTREFTELKSGQFICNVNSRKRYFKTRFTMYQDKEAEPEIKRIITENDLYTCYKQTQSEVEEIINRFASQADTYVLKMGQNTNQNTRMKEIN